jgi:type IX secretion system PorP/SprF family membrane protein
MSVIKKAVSAVLLIIPFFVSQGQETPFHPVSYRIFTPFIFNPAVAGSKDFTSIDVLASLQNNSYSQIISANTRLWSKGPGYTISPKLKKHSNFGLGGFLFNDLISSNRNLGIGLTGSYHFALDKKELSFLSVGVTAKGIYSHLPGDTLFAVPEKNHMSPNIDAGIYYYNPSFYIGLSASNILGNPTISDSEDLIVIPVSRQYFFHTGYKFVISKPLNIVIEPNLIITNSDTISFDMDYLSGMIEPGLKIYFGKFCVGTYFQDYDKIPFFFQFKYPKFYVGTFFQIPRNIPFYKKDLTAEIVFGFNLTNNQLEVSRGSHW